MPDLFGRKDPSARRVAAADSVVVIGLGRFGRSLALELAENDTEVLGIDNDEGTVQELSTRADSTNEDALRQLAVNEFDRAVVAIGSHIEASILTASLLKNMGIRNIWAKAISEPHGRILEQLGIPHVAYPEHEMGRRVAHLVRGRMLDFIQFEPDYAMVKTDPPDFLLGMPLSQTGVRRKHGVTIVGVKTPDTRFQHATGETVLSAGDTIIAAGLRQLGAGLALDEAHLPGHASRADRPRGRQRRQRAAGRRPWPTPIRRSRSVPPGAPGHPLATPDVRRPAPAAFRPARSKQLTPAPPCAASKPTEEEPARWVGERSSRRLLGGAVTSPGDGVTSVSRSRPSVGRRCGSKSIPCKPRAAAIRLTNSGSDGELGWGSESRGRGQNGLPRQRPHHRALRGADTLGRPS